MSHLMKSEKKLNQQNVELMTNEEPRNLWNDPMNDGLIK